MSRKPSLALVLISLLGVSSGDGGVSLDVDGVLLNADTAKGPTTTTTTKTTTSLSASLPLNPSVFHSDNATFAGDASPEWSANGHVAGVPGEQLEDDNYVDYVEDLEFSERLRDGDVDMSEVPRHLLALDDNDGTPIEIKPASRLLSPQSAQIGTFQPLDCNPDSWTSSSCSALVSDNMPSAGQPLTIPCNQCLTFDMTGDVTFADGIDIKGKLVFPVNHQATVYTPFVIVQGELEITVDHAQISPDNQATRFILTGTQDIIFTPTDAPNQNACPGNACNLGRKPFVVAGGKVNINSMPETCPTFTTVLGKRYKEPTYDPEDFPTVVSLPPSCPTSGESYVSYDFNGSYGNWTGRWGTYTEMVEGNTAMRVSNRRISHRGPAIDLTPVRPELCLEADQEYLFSAR